jgi:DNA-binding LytR/AlgR family response regulator
MKHVSRSNLPGYGVAGVSTALATLAQFPLRPLVGSQHPYSFFYVAVLITAWYAGLRRALLALILGALSANYFFLPPEKSLAITGAANQVGLALYLLVALVGTLLIEALRQQQRPAGELAGAPSALLARERAARAAAEEAQRRLIAARQGARALADQLTTVREELARANERLHRQRPGVDPTAAALPLRPGEGAPAVAVEPLARLPICGIHSVRLLRVAEIDYAECRNQQVFVRTGTGEHPTGYSLADLEALLPTELFIRVHDAYLVNQDRIRDLVFLESDCHEIRLSDGQRLPVDRGRCPQLRRRLGLEEGS